MPFTRFVDVVSVGGKNTGFILSIYPRAIFQFSVEASRKLQTHHYKYIKLYFDKDNRKLGFSFTNDDKDSGLIKLRHLKKTCLFSCTAILKTFSIKYDSPKRYPINIEGNIYFIEVGN